MKKLISALTAMVVTMFATGAFATIEPAATEQSPYNGKDYVGQIVAASYSNDANGKEILLMTKVDKMNESNVTGGFTIRVTDKDIPFGLTLAGAVGKKIAVSFKNSNYEISSVDLITDEYWNGSKA